MDNINEEVFCVHDESQEASDIIEEMPNEPSCQELQEEVECLENNLTAITPTKSLNLDEKSVQKVLIDINFRNKKTYFAFHEEFIEIIKKYYKDKIDDLDVCDDAGNKRICISEKLVKKSDSFLIDTTPNIENNKNSTESTPRYTSFSKVILSSKPDLEEEKLVPMNSANKCFNCDKPHSLRQCPEPRNMLKIRKARNEFNKKELRYHDNDEYSDLVPGQLSNDLKSALGLTDNQLPLHIYKMRNHGYPLAWLEEAKVYYSGLQILTDKDNELNDKCVKGNFKYDVQRIYDFPGFNVPPTLPYVDKHLLYNLPPMQVHHSKEEFISSLGNDFVVNGYKKRKLRNSIEKFDTSTNIEDIEMDVENEVGSSQSNLLEPNGGVNLNNTPEDGELSNNSENSLDAEELDVERKKLLKELSTINDTQFEHETNLINEDLIKDNQESNVDESKDIKQGHVETTIFGCPVLPSFSPFENLPSNEKFQEGVCDVIAFENLSESTGKYEKMKGIIKKVRVFVKEHHKD